MKYILFIAAILIMASCVTEKKCNSKFPPKIIVKDSIVYKDRLVVRDTTLYVTLPKDTITNYDTIYVKDGQALILKPLELIGAYSDAFAWISNNKLYGKLIEGKGDSLAFTLKGAIQERDVWKEKYQNKEVTRTIKENTKFAGFTIAFFWSILALIILGGIFLYLFVKIRK